MKASKAIVENCNIIFSESKSFLVNETTAAWNEIADQMQAYYGLLGDVAWTGKQLRERIVALPLGMVLVFLRVNEQLGMEVRATLSFFFYCNSKIFLFKVGRSYSASD